MFTTKPIGTNTLTLSQVNKYPTGLPPRPMRKISSAESMTSNISDPRMLPSGRTTPTSEQNLDNVSSCLFTEENFATATNMSNLDVECVLTSGRSLDNLPSSSTPYAIIKYGPTGSGKGSATVQQEIQQLGVPINDYAVFEIDSLVESVKKYRNRTLNIKSKYSTASNKRGMYKNLINAYMNTRKNLSRKLDKVLDEAVQTKKNFIFETTGQTFRGKNPIEWLMERIETVGGGAYKIVVLYPLVTPDVLKQRVQKRAEAQSLKQNKPFYRAVNPDTLEEATLMAKFNLSLFLLPEVFQKRIHKLVVFWNE